MNIFPVYDVRYIKIKIRTYGDKVYASFRDLNVPQDNAEWESFTIVSIDSLLVYENKCYLQVYLDNFSHRILDKQRTDNLDDHPFEIDED